MVDYPIKILFDTNSFLDYPGRNELVKKTAEYWWVKQLQSPVKVSMETDHRKQMMIMIIVISISEKDLFYARLRNDFDKLIEKYLDWLKQIPITH